MTVMAGRGTGGQMVMGGHYWAIWASHWCACVCVKCCNIIAMSLYCKDDKCYYSAASLHHSAAAALVICFHCDAREQLQK